ncbi:MAG: type II toxin-antitoxin system HicA family toxin [Acetobacteraceae bacterium]|nr:type II toxin-antitoxin system HicA family toxin [Acetobacteraceae bacterium]
MDGAALARKLRRLAKQWSLEFSYEARHGKGGHLTTVKDLKKEIGPGLLHAILNQLGLTKDDLLR